MNALKQHEVPCPVCEKSEYKILYEPWREVNDPVKLFGAASGERGTQQIVQCRTAGCGMIYVSPRYDDAVIFEGYRNAEDQGHDTQYDSRVETCYLSLKKHARWLPPPGSRALDIGCAGGAYVQAAQKYGYRATGLEPSLALAESGRRRGLDIIQGTLETYQPAEQFDLISLWDVLEHVTEPTDVLKRCRKLLKPGGAILINYPDAGTLQAKVAGKYFWWFLSVHLWYFDRHTIRRILEKTGFELTSVRRHVQRLELGYLMNVARIYNQFLASLGDRLVPSFFKRRLMPYYASQTTAIARLKS